MIDYHEIGSTTSRMDTLAEERGLEIVLKDMNVQLEGLFKAAEQRAMRIALIAGGYDPRKLPRNRKTNVDRLFTPEMHHMSKFLQMAFVDGFVAGRSVHDPADRIQRFPQQETQDG
jgi:hypothetical protein